MKSLDLTIDPVLIGITGHRNIPDEEIGRLIPSIEKCLQALMLDGNNQHLCIASGLAEGADRLVVEVAIELNIPYMAVLPMPAHEYINDFKDQKSIQHFERLLAKASQVKVLQATVINQPTDRDACYHRLAMFLAQKSAVLMALWDGDEHEKPGGTSQVVRYFKELHHNHADCFKHIPTRRMTQSKPIGQPS